MSADPVPALLGVLPLPALLIGPDERVAHANRGAQALLGQGLVERHYVTVLRQPDILDAIEACLRDGTAATTRFLASDHAQDATFNVSCAAVEVATGRAVLVCFEDVTPMEKASQMRRDFVANVSHELRTPLTALMGFIETLRGPARGDAKATERFLSIMQAEAARMERLVRDLLSLSRVESEERMRPTARADMRKLVGQVMHAMRGQAEAAGVALQADLAEGALSVPGDADQLTQVLTNLVENAIKYGGRGGGVIIAVRLAERDPALRAPALILSVSDQGPGIEAVHIPRLTERFYRVDTHRSREMGGTGLGLAIVKHIVSRHRGRLRITSEPGQGSTFTVTLPR